MLCRLQRRLFPHRSKRDRLVRNVCTSCFSSATLTEERGGRVDWDQARTYDDDSDLLSWLRSE
jgi:hypothetical protein